MSVRILFSRRWFTPTVEVDLCGHATLAAGWLVMERLAPDARVYGEYHALIVRHAKEVCRKTAPLCGGCVLQRVCLTGRGELLAREQVS